MYPSVVQRGLTTNSGTCKPLDHLPFKRGGVTLKGFRCAFGRRWEKPERTWPAGVPKAAPLSDNTTLLCSSSTTPISPSFSNPWSSRNWERKWHLRDARRSWAGPASYIYYFKKFFTFKEDQLICKRKRRINFSAIHIPFPWTPLKLHSSLYSTQTNSKSIESACSWTLNTNDYNHPLPD